MKHKGSKGHTEEEIFLGGVGRLSVFHQEKGEEVFPLEESPRAEASHGEPTSCVKSGIGGLTGRAASPAAARRSARSPPFAISNLSETPSAPPPYERYFFSSSSTT